MKQGSKTHSSLRQSNFQLQYQAALMSRRIRAVERRKCAAGLAGAHLGLQDIILLNYTRIASHALCRTLFVWRLTLARPSHPGHSTILLRSEIPSGICSKLRTVAASNNRDRPTRSFYYCLFAPHSYIVVLRARPVRGESRNQRNTTGEIATRSNTHLKGLAIHCQRLAESPKYVLARAVTWTARTRGTILIRKHVKCRHLSTNTSFMVQWLNRWSICKELESEDQQEN